MIVCNVGYFWHYFCGIIFAMMKFMKFICMYLGSQSSDQMVRWALGL